MADVSVRLAYKGGDQAIVAALDKVIQKGRQAGGAISSSFSEANAVLRATRGLFAALGVAVGVQQLIGFTKNASIAADSAGELAEGVNATVVNFQAAARAAGYAGVKTDQFQKALARVVSKVLELRRGESKTKDLFKTLGLSEGQFRGKDSVQQLELVAKALARVRDENLRAGLAFEFFGEKVGPRLNTFLRELAQRGLPSLREEAERLGLVFDEKMVASAGRLEVTFGDLNKRNQILALSFLTGLTPALEDTARAMTSVGDSAGAFARTGEFIGVVLKGLVLTVDALWTGLLNSGDALGALAVASVKATSFQFKAARDVLDRASFDIDQRNQKLRMRVSALLSPNRNETPAPAGPSDFGGSGLGLGADQKSIDAAKKAILDAENEIRDLLGQHHKADLAEVEEKGRRLAETLKKAGIAQHLINDAVKEYTDQLRAAAGFAESIRRFEAELADVERQKNEIRAAIAANQIDEVRGGELLLKIEQERVKKLQTLLRLARSAALATQNPENVTKTDEEALKIANLGAVIDQNIEAMKRLKEAGRDALVDGLTQFLSGAAFEADNLQRAIFDLVRSLQNILARHFAEQLISFLLPTPVKKAEGGLISGPGTGTSDSVPAMLSSGEYVVRAGAVDRPGVLQQLEAINRGLTLRAPSFAVPPLRFAEGGLVGAGSKGGHLSGEVGIALADEFKAQYLRVDNAERFVLTVLAKRPRAVGAILGGRR